MKTTKMIELMETTGRTGTGRRAGTRRWPERHLKELIAFLDERYGGRLDLRHFASVMGFSYQYASAVFVKDDMRLSRAEKITRLYGHRLRLFFPMRTYPFDLTWEHAPVKDLYPGCGNLTGLLQYVLDSNMTINRLQNLAGVTNLKPAFVSGDIFLSKMYRILDALEIDVIWEFEKTEDNPIINNIKTRTS